MLRRTLASMIAADYPHDTWLLDEGDDPRCAGLCASWGSGISAGAGSSNTTSRAGRFLAKTKAGNHNAWYAQYAGQYDIVAQVDTDFKVRRDFLTRTLGYFSDPRIAFVGTPQIYGNVGNLVARGAASRPIFLRPDHAGAEPPADDAADRRQPHRARRRAAARSAGTRAI